MSEQSAPPAAAAAGAPGTDGHGVHPLASRLHRREPRHRRPSGKWSQVRRRIWPLPRGAMPMSLGRFMRTLTNFGILALGDDGRFSLTPLGEPLRSDVPGSVRSSILTHGRAVELAGLGGVSVNGQDRASRRIDMVFGMPVFDWLAQHPDEAKRFSETMVAVHGAEPPAVAAAYDFSSCGVIVDVGGASGNLLGHVLAKHPRPKGVLFDLPQAMTDAPARLQALGVEDRVTIQAGSAFEAVPPGADAYLLSHVIHDWNEDQCLTILRNCRAAMTPTSRLLIIELVLREGNAPGFGSSDMVMMTLTGGAGANRPGVCIVARTSRADDDAGGSDDHQREHRRSPARLARICETGSTEVNGGTFPAVRPARWSAPPSNDAWLHGRSAWHSRFVESDVHPRRPPGRQWCLRIAWPARIRRYTLHRQRC